MDIKNLFIGLVTATVVLTIFETIQTAIARPVRMNLNGDSFDRADTNDRLNYQRKQYIKERKMQKGFLSGIIYTGKGSKW